MEKFQNRLSLALRGSIFIYLPGLVLLFGLYELLFEVEMSFHWYVLLLYLVLVVNWIVDKYKYETMEEEVHNREYVEKILNENKWEVHDRRRERLVVAPTFDFPLNKIINSIVEIQFSNQTVSISGPAYYVSTLSKMLQAQENSRWGKTFSLLKGLLAAVFVLSPLIAESGVVWEAKVLHHNYQAEASDRIEAISEKSIGNTVENINNYGAGVENADHIFYIEDDFAIVKTDKEFNTKEYLIHESTGDSYSDLNLVGEWLYYTRGETLNRMKTDGTKEAVMYDLGYVYDVHIRGKWLFFINLEDDASVYRMNLDGQNLQRIFAEPTRDIALYEDELLISYGENDEAVVERMSLDGKEREVLFHEEAQNVISWEDQYYYIDENFRLYRIKMVDTATPELLVDEDISSYTIGENEIYYSLLSEETTYPGSGLYKMQLDGSQQTQLLVTERLSGLTKVGESLLFSSSPQYGLITMKKLDLETNKIETLSF
ncbi:DUF5050 domain-containing protein [Lacticigenium naphthae]|uniref:DUF5050 domain-containing protein n=1 Tax=Lacticigenium naphthae TaxID=515351 RepID=UPI000406CE54|nr:DUF5050 domain-containing protein [Lacticigenium naphthae]